MDVKINNFNEFFKDELEFIDGECNDPTFRAFRIDNNPHMSDPNHLESWIVKGKKKRREKREEKNRREKEKRQKRGRGKKEREKVNQGKTDTEQLNTESRSGMITYNNK